MIKHIKTDFRANEDIHWFDVDGKKIGLFIPCDANHLIDENNISYHQERLRFDLIQELKKLNRSNI